MPAERMETSPTTPPARRTSRSHGTVSHVLRFRGHHTELFPRVRYGGPRIPELGMVALEFNSPPTVAVMPEWRSGA